MCDKHSQAFAALLSAHEPDRMGPLFLDWLADRLVCVYGESENIDFVLCLRRRADKARKAIALAESVKNEKHQAFTDMLAALEYLIIDGDFYSDSIYFNEYDGIAINEHIQSIIAQARKEMEE